MIKASCATKGCAHVFVLPCQYAVQSLMMSHEIQCYVPHWFPLVHDLFYDFLTWLLKNLSHTASYSYTWAVMTKTWSMFFWPSHDSLQCPGGAHLDSSVIPAAGWEPSMRSMAGAPWLRSHHVVFTQQAAWRKLEERPCKSIVLISLYN